MNEREIAALESYQLLPRLIHGVHTVDSRCELLGVALDSPLLPLVTAGNQSPGKGLCLLDADVCLAHPETFSPASTLPLLATEKMGILMPKVRKLAALDVPGLVLDVSHLADTPPYGSRDWRPRTREDLAELRAAAGSPLWLYGVSSSSDAEAAVEVGLEGIVVHAGAGAYLGGPSTIEVLPEILDAVAGMIGVYAGGLVRSGIDLFRYLAVGAEGVVVGSDRSLSNLEAELHYAMRLTGCETLSDLGYEAFFAPLFEEW
ncbi:MAG: alpha-hydroxy-acid oxidizing protein [Trueperaceae bacterium]|nr:MAG: alpha-hydroxy-acid oxidizing protein [Trueperaceae bacterium]